MANAKRIAMLLTKFIVFLILVCPRAFTTTTKKSYNFIFRRELLAPDNFNASVITVNGQFPGPVIRVSVGDRLVVNATNFLSNSELLSLHFHGISQRGTPWSDGTAGVTNCGIYYGNTHSYEFTVDKAGTYWYHLHNEAERGEGGYGFLIVEDTTHTEREGIGVYDEELLIILSDWYHKPYEVIQANENQFGVAGEWPGNGNAILVNGKGRQTIYLDVQQNKIYRIRLLNAASLAVYNFAIAGHNLTVVMAGSTLTEHVQLQSVDIGVAERYDMLLNTNCKSMIYRISVQMNYQGTDMSPSGFLDTVYLRYDNSAILSTLVPLNETKPPYEQVNQLKPLYPPITLPPPKREIILNVSQQYVGMNKRGQGQNSNGFIRWTINQIGYEKAVTPPLLASYYNMMDTAYDTDSTRPFLRLEYGEVIQLVIQNTASEMGACDLHTWHIHGYNVYVLGYGPGLYDPVIDKAFLNTDTPMLLDTFLSIPNRFVETRNIGLSSSQIYQADNFGKPCGWTVIRIIANNPGFWHFHCHMDWDMTIGMGAVLEVAPEVLWDVWNLTLPASYELCGAINAHTKNPRVNSGDISSDGVYSDSGQHHARFVIILFSICIIFLLIIICLIIFIRLLYSRLLLIETKYKSLPMESLHCDIEMRDVEGHENSRHNPIMNSDSDLAN